MWALNLGFSDCRYYSFSNACYTITVFRILGISTITKSHKKEVHVSFIGKKKSKQVPSHLGTQASQVALPCSSQQEGTSAKQVCPRRWPKICTRGFHWNPTSLKIWSTSASRVVSLWPSGQVPRWNQGEATMRGKMDIGKQVTLLQPRYLHSASTLRTHRKIRIGMVGTSRRKTVKIAQ